MARQSLTWVRALSLVLAGLLAGCAPSVREPEKAALPSAPADFPTEFYRKAAARGASVWRIEPAASEVLVYVYRGGPWARLGHNHVIVSRDTQGFVLRSETPGEGRADLYLPLLTLSVDEPELRAAAGPEFDTRPTERDIAGTRRNMLGEKLLEAERFPFAVLHATLRDQRDDVLYLQARITIHGVTRERTTEARIETTEDKLRVSGALDLRQSEFGITPFSVLGGKLRVEDRVRVVYDLSAKALSSASSGRSSTQ